MPPEQWAEVTSMRDVDERANRTQELYIEDMEKTERELNKAQSLAERDRE